MDDTHRRETHTQTDTEPSELPPQKRAYETCAAGTRGKISRQWRDLVNLGGDMSECLSYPTLWPATEDGWYRVDSWRNVSSPRPWYTG